VASPTPDNPTNKHAATSQAGAVNPASASVTSFSPTSSGPTSPGPAAAKLEPIVEVRNLVKRFGSQTVLSGINLEVYPGETLVIMGGSGCGKSTLLRCLIGSLIPEEGSVRLFGEDVSKLKPMAVDELRKKFGILFQSGALYNSMSIADNVALPLRELTNISEEVIDITVKMKLELVGLRADADKLPSQISGGMKKRAGLARAMALDPRILFYDEPSAGLDPITSSEIDKLIVHMTKGLGVTSVVVTHEMDSAFTIADRMVMLDRGRVLRIDSRDWFSNLRGVPPEEVGKLTSDERLIRQFLRGEPTADDQRDMLGYERDLLKAGPRRIWPFSR